MISPLHAVRTAFAWLTVAPVGEMRTEPDRRLGGAVMAAVPLVGVALGAVLAAAAFGLGHTALPAPLIGVLLVAAAALLTRGMHLDGLADTADGLGCYGPPERVAEVMRSGSVGPFGAATLIVVLAVEALSLGTFVDQSRWYDIAFVIALGRFGALIGARAPLRPAHADGFGALVAGTTRRSIPIWSLGAVAAAAGLGVRADGLDLGRIALGWAAVVVVALFAWLFTRHCVRRMGGVTGDLLGATIELSVAASAVVLLLG